MQVVVTAQASGLDASVSPLFGRCPAYVFVDTDTMEAESVGNPAASAPGGAGIQAAQYVLGRQPDAIITGNLGPNANGVIMASGIKVYRHAATGTVRDAVTAFVDGKLESMSGSNVAGHFGTGGGGGSGRGMRRR